MKTVRDAKKEPIEPGDLPSLFADKTRLLVAKGKKFHDLKFADLSEGELEKLVVGPSGRLRAPTLMRGKRVMVGFHPEAYGSFLGR